LVIIYKWHSEDRKNGKRKGPMDDHVISPQNQFISLLLDVIIFCGISLAVLDSPIAYSSTSNAKKGFCHSTTTTIITTNFPSFQKIKHKWGEGE